MVRRTIGFVLFGALMFWLGDMFAYRKNNFLGDIVGDSPVQSILFFVLLLATLALVAWTLRKPTWWKTLLAFGLGIVCAVFGVGLITGITWWFLIGAGVLILVLAVLWMVTTWVALPSWLSAIGRRAQTGTTTPAPAPAPAPVP